MRLLVTGGNGFIGTYLRQILRENSIDYAVASRSNGFDLSNDDSVKRILEEYSPTHLIHLSWVVDHGVFWTSEKNKDAHLYSVRLAKEFYGRGGTYFLGLGTCAEYNWAGLKPLHEGSELKPNTTYGVSKMQTYLDIEDLSDPMIKKFCWVRPFFPYGPGEPSTKLIPSILNSALTETPLKLSHPKNMRDFIHVIDLASAIYLLMTHECVGAYNVSSGEHTTLEQVIRLSEAITNKKINVEFSSTNTGYDEVIGSNEKIRTTVNWNPAWSLEAGIKNYFDVFLKRGYG